jgi:hypothetical protein
MASLLHFVSVFALNHSLLSHLAITWISAKTELIASSLTSSGQKTKLPLTVKPPHDGPPTR